MPTSITARSAMPTAKSWYRLRQATGRPRTMSPACATSCPGGSRAGRSSSSRPTSPARSWTSARPPPAPGRATRTTEPPAQLLGNLADLGRGTEAANINHYNVQPIFNVYANVQGRDLGAVSADVQKIVDTARQDLPRGSSIVIRGQVE